MTSDPDQASLSLTEIDSQRSPEEQAMDGKSGRASYKLNHIQEDGTTTETGKVTEIHPIDKAGEPGLQALADKDYSHYAIFRLQDRSTTVLIQDGDGCVFKTLTLGRNSVKVTHQVRIEKATEN
jgi:hypothetical protein